MILKEFRGKRPKYGQGTYIAETAALIGDVTIGRDCSIWFSTVIRADGNSVEIGDRVSVQDCACIHISNHFGCNVVIGDDVIIGHNATVHGCKVGSHCLIGMGSTILDGAEVGDGAIVAAGAMVKGGTKVGPGELWGGVPAVFIKKIGPEASKLIDAGVAEYVDLAHEFNASGND